LTIALACARDIVRTLARREPEQAAATLRSIGGLAEALQAGSPEARDAAAEQIIALINPYR
jgi:hypothetical protein